MIFPFPYTNLYNLNLDWMIKTMKEMQEIVEPLSRVVNSVNGMTGDVQITKQFLLQILESMVSKFNGRAGDVTLTAADVNSTMIDITWTSDPGDVIEDIAQNVRDQLYAIGKRVLIFVNNQGVPDQIYFLTLVGDVVTPQIYSPTAALAGVASFNGQTGAVTATGSDLDTANDDDTPISESIGDLQSAVNDQSQQIDDLGPINNLTSDSTTAALSAAQGKALNQKLGDLTALETSVKTDLVSAVNDNKDSIDQITAKTAVSLSDCASLADIFTRLMSAPGNAGAGGVGSLHNTSLKTVLGQINLGYATAVCYLIGKDTLNAVIICVAGSSLEGNLPIYVKYLYKNNTLYTQTDWITYQPKA